MPILSRRRRSSVLAAAVAVVATVLPSLPSVAGDDQHEASTDDAPERIIGRDPSEAVARWRGESQPGDAAEWMPFVGTFGAGCTLANPAGPGGCPAHHPTWALDVLMGLGRKVRATGPGVVVDVVRDCSPTGGPDACNGGAGNYVAVLHGDYLSRYLHLSAVPRRVRVGQRVAAGDVIGRVGGSGTLDGAVHLHYDEATAPPAELARVEFGKVKACHGDTAVIYPDVLGYDEWTDVPWGTPMRNDGYTCEGHPTLPHPPPPAPPVYPPVAPLGLGGSPGVAVGDLDFDGEPDLAVGVVGADVDGQRNAGAVVLVDPGRRRQSRLVAQGQGAPGLLEAGDRFGAAVAIGDFDCDSRDDLAIGSPGEDLDETFVDVGSVTVLYADGGSQLIYAGNGVQEYSLRPGDWLGAVMTTGDFDGDGCEDLAASAPGADRAGLVDTGVVWALLGSAAGLQEGILLLPGVQLGGTMETGDRVGMSLAAGDFNCDGSDDLAVGVPGEEVDGERGAGAVFVAYGGSPPFAGVGLGLTQGSGGLGGLLESGDAVGAAVAAGDHNGDGCADLALGAPGEDLIGAPDGGAVSIVLGSRRGLRVAEPEVVFAGQGMAGAAAPGDRLGTAVMLVDRNCNGHDEVVAGVPGRDVGGAGNAGSLAVHGDSVRPVARPMLRQGGRLAGAAETGDAVGSLLAAGDVDGDGCADLLSSARGEAIGGSRAVGAVDILISGADGTRLHLTQRGPVAGKLRAGNIFGGATPLRLIR